MPDVSQRSAFFVKQNKHYEMRFKNLIAKVYIIDKSVEINLHFRKYSQCLRKLRCK